MPKAEPSKVNTLHNHQIKRIHFVKNCSIKSNKFIQAIQWPRHASQQMGPRTSCKKKPSKWCSHCSPSKSDTHVAELSLEPKNAEARTPQASTSQASTSQATTSHGVQKQKLINFWTSRQALAGCATLRLELKLKEWNFTAKVQVQTLRLQRNFAKSSKKSWRWKLGCPTNLELWRNGFVLEKIT